MHILDTPIPDLKIIQLDIHGDNRGFFIERFHAKRFSEHHLHANFVQDNHSRSAPGILRGLHYQHSAPQGKLVGVTRGKVWDVAVDIRPDSPTCGQHYAVELSDENGQLFWIPPGFAHGFCVLGSEPADMLYKVTAYYNQEGEGGICYDDPALAIDWPIHTPTVSERDAKLPQWNTYLHEAPAW